jgi:hypothetical protein
MCCRPCHSEILNPLFHGMTFFKSTVGCLIRSNCPGTGHQQSDQENIAGYLCFHGYADLQ